MSMKIFMVDSVKNAYSAANVVQHPMVLDASHYNVELMLSHTESLDSDM